MLDCGEDDDGSHNGKDVGDGDDGGTWGGDDDGGDDSIDNLKMVILSPNSTTGASDNVQEDLDFFKTCIVDYYCFEKDPNKHTWINFPNFKDLIGTTYFNAMAKRIQLFFIRYNTWSNTLVDAKFRDVATGMKIKLVKKPSFKENSTLVYHSA